MTKTAGRATTTAPGSGAAELSGLELQAELGRGAFTIVHRVRHDGRLYALKRPAGATRDPGLLAEFQREAALLACCDDPVFGRIHAAGRFGCVT